MCKALSTFSPPLQKIKTYFYKTVSLIFFDRRILLGTSVLLLLTSFLLGCGFPAFLIGSFIESSSSGSKKCQVTPLTSNPGMNHFLSDCGNPVNFRAQLLSKNIFVLC
jgi:hypothetical protein